MNQVEKKVLKLFAVFVVLLCNSILLMGQSEFTVTLQKNFEEYRMQALQEKVFVHTDKDFYLAGEILWFKAYHVDGYFHKSLDLDKVLYVEILDRNNKALLQAKIELTDGSGRGSFVLPTSIQSGNYLLRAYTNWMKNFGPEIFFEKTITVVNTFRKPTWNEKTDTASYDIQFFPEGGSLVNGIESRVGFKVTDQTGRGVECSGSVVNSNNETIARFQSFRFGMGQFNLKPVKGEKYTALIQPQGNAVVHSSLPNAIDEGYVMKVTANTNDQLNVTVSTNINAANSLPVYLFVHSQQLIKKIESKEIKNGEAVFVFDKKILGDGISHLTVFNSQRQPLCERLVFKRPTHKLTIDLKSDQPVYSARTKVSLDLSTSTQGLLEPANMSMSVFMIDSLQAADENDIASYLLLKSELRGNIESASYYLMNSGADAEQAADNLMLTQGWRRFKWADILSGSKPGFEFLPEFEGQIIYGRVVDKRNGQPAAAVTGWLSVPGSLFNLSTAVSDKNGRLRFIAKHFYGSNEMILQANTRLDSAYRIDISIPYSDKFSKTRIPDFDVNEKWKNQLTNRSVGAQAYGAYFAKQQQIFLPPSSMDTTVFFGRPDRKYLLDDYTRFTTMEEVMKEYVPEIRVRKRSDKFHYEAFNLPYKTFFEEDPLLLIDGVPVFNADKILAFDPLKIKKLELVARKYYLGQQVISGIASYTTYDGDLAGFQLDANAVILEYQGLQLQREFYSPVYGSKEQSDNRLPDFRNVLYWSPDLQTDETGKKKIEFYTSDMPGKYAVFVQGLTAGGLPGSNMVIIDVKK